MGEFMKIYLLLSFILFGSSVFAKNYELTDAAIRGEYKLVKTNSKSEIQKAEVVYNADNALVVRVERNDGEYELSEPNKNGVVFEGEDECNAGSGDEPNCYFDAKTIIKLQPVKVRGEEIPQLTIEITVMDGYDENYEETITYVLNWSKSLDHAIPYYINIQSPPALKQLSTACELELKDIGYDSAAGYLNVYDICPHASTFQYREPFSKSFEALKKEWVGKNSKDSLEEITPKEAKQLFNKARALAKKYKKKKDSSVTSKKILAQIKKVEDYVLAADQIYFHKYIRDAMFFVVDKDKKIISRFGIKITNKYED